VKPTNGEWKVLLLAPAAAVFCGFCLCITRDPGELGPSSLELLLARTEGWSADAGLVLTAAPAGGAAWRLSWEHDEHHPPLAGTLYRLELRDGWDAALLGEPRDLDRATCTVDLSAQPRLSRQVLWRVRAAVGGADYAAANGKLSTGAEPVPDLPH